MGTDSAHEGVKTLPFQPNGVDDEEQHVVTAVSIITVTIGLERQGLDTFMGRVGLTDEEDNDAEELDEEDKDMVDEEEDDKEEEKEDRGKGKAEAKAEAEGC